MTDFITLRQSESAANSGWVSTLDVFELDEDGDIQVHIDDLSDDDGRVYLDQDAQRVLRDFLNDALGDADDGDDVVAALDGLTDAIYDLSTALRDPVPAKEIPAIEIPQKIADLVASFVASGKDRYVL